jgi:hypothetical protein
MTALELAEYFEDADGSVSDSNVAAMLRAQHEAIKTLREALEHSVKYVPELNDVPGIKAALAATEGMV